jgi:hypothetical protein
MLTPHSIQPTVQNVVSEVVRLFEIGAPKVGVDVRVLEVRGVIIQGVRSCWEGWWLFGCLGVFFGGFLLGEVGWQCLGQIIPLRHRPTVQLGPKSRG